MAHREPFFSFTYRNLAQPAGSLGLHRRPSEIKNSKQICIL